jgi:hypothetical protein
MSIEVPESEFFHNIYGLRLCANRRLPGLISQPPGLKADLRVVLREAAHGGDDGPQFAPDQATVCYVSPYIGDFGVPILKIEKSRGDGAYRIRYDDGTQFIVGAAATAILATWPPEMSFEDTVTYLFGPVLGFVLHLRGLICLHASAVVVDGHAVAFLGFAGAGKSTTAATFARLGFPVLTDDLVVLREHGGGYFVQPGYARICLAPDATKSLFGGADALPEIAPNWEKRGLALGDTVPLFAPAACPLRAIYVLSGQATPSPSQQFKSLSPQESLLAVLPNVFVQYLLTPEQRAAEFPALGRLISAIPFVNFHSSGGIDRLSENCQSLANDFSRRLRDPPAFA